ncbi:hypothetical protein PybrP1_004269 [[Pythium] brassicae (nom. inval.)]|nr:hypothetical protein PybrP1_004269 [[Pythium] brassicae (nom. inval.)]
MAPPHALHFDAAPEASDFFFGTVLGQGSYAKVFHARMKNNKMDFAVKVMDQSFIRKENKAAFVLTERKVLSRLAHPNIVKFYCSFRLVCRIHSDRPSDLTAASVRADEYKKNHDAGVADTACSLETTRFYVAETVQALEYMHSMDQEDTNNDINQFCGTVSYVSPEVLHDKPATRACDLWALGCILFQMLTGRTPFVAENDYLTFQVIINHESDTFEFPESVPEDARDLIRRLLVQEPSERIGASQDEAGYAELKNHPFFDGVDWDALETQVAPYTPPPLELSEPKLDGASEHWTVAEYFSDDAFSESTTEDLMSRRSRSSGSLRGSKPACMSYDEQVRFEGKVKIHSKMFKRARELVLTDAPRLLVLSAWSGKFKKEILLTADTKVNPIGQHTFDIISPSGTFRVTDPNLPTQNWVCAILDAISNAD